MNFLGKNIRHLRKQLSKTQSEIALLLKKGQTTVGNWENGISEPSLDELIVLSNYFDISLDILIRSDLSEESDPFGQGHGKAQRYDHSSADLTVVREEEDKLSFVIQELKAIREDIEHLYAQLPEGTRPIAAN
jgi:transcriptional regulator with XRE-family HTH domain